MNASDALYDLQSYAEAGDDDDAERLGSAIDSLAALIDAAGRIVDGENDVRRGNVAGSYPYDIADLASALGRKLEPHPDFGDDDA